MELDTAFGADPGRTVSANRSNATNNSPSEPLDLSHLSRYTLGDRELEREILGLFIDQVPKSIEQLNLASTDKDWQMAAHTLKGSSRAVGAWRVADLAERAERIPVMNDCSARRIALAELKQAAVEVRAFITSLAKAKSSR